ncbi:MAG: hypothetical protein PHI49_08195 [Halothiobacillaceae bacterium]|nr:hypothetical protein [Halothiobacillaceae bacterium]
MKIIRLLLLPLLALPLVSCMIPEDFHLRIDLAQHRQMHALYQGITWYNPIGKNTVTAQDVEKIIEDARKQPEIREIRHIGGNRFDIRAEYAWVAQGKEKKLLFSLVEVKPDAEGRLLFRAGPGNPNRIREYREKGLHFAGEVLIHLVPGYRIVEQSGGQCAQENDGQRCVWRTEDVLEKGLRLSVEDAPQDGV